VSDLILKRQTGINREINVFMPASERGETGKDKPAPFEGRVETNEASAEKKNRPGGEARA